MTVILLALLVYCDKLFCDNLFFFNIISFSIVSNKKQNMANAVCK